MASCLKAWAIPGFGCFEMFCVALKISSQKKLSYFWVKLWLCCPYPLTISHKIWNSGRRFAQLFALLTMSLQLAHFEQDLTSFRPVWLAPYGDLELNLSLQATSISLRTSFPRLDCSRAGCSVLLGSTAAHLFCPSGCQLYHMSWRGTSLLHGLPVWATKK